MIAGEYGSLKKRRTQGAAAAAWTASSSRQSVALVVGSASVVGAALLDFLSLPRCPGGPWRKVYAVSHVAAPPPWSAPPLAVTHLHLDLAEPAAVAQALTPLADITHVFYFAWEPRPTEAEHHGANPYPAMLRNVLSVVVPNCPALAHVCLQTSLLPREHDTDPTESLSEISPLGVGPYSKLDDVLLDVVAQQPGGAAITWSVHRAPTTIFGFPACGATNVVSSLCVYAAICRKKGMMLRWPGSRVAWEGFSVAADMEFVAEQALWAAVELSRKNQKFACRNRDVFTWKQLWPILARHFGVRWVEYEGENQRFKLAAAMAGMDATWAAIVEENGLVKTNLHEITNWSFVDAMINVDKELLDTKKKSTDAKEFGFSEFPDTMWSFETWIDVMKDDMIVP